MQGDQFVGQKKGEAWHSTSQHLLTKKKFIAAE
jgi:hypothetical protein